MENPLKQILAVIPTYNERDNIRKVIKKVLSQDERMQILVIDDGSPDGTGQIVEEIIETNSRVHIIKREGKQGLGTAYVAGFTYALENNYDAIVQIDADLSHNPNDVPRLIKYAEKGADFVIGSRYVNGVNVVNWPLHRLMISYFASIYARLITGMPFRDTTAGFSLIRRNVLEAIDWKRVSTQGYGFQIEIKYLTWIKGFRIKECPIVFVERVEGSSKMNRRIMVEAVTLVWKLRLGRIIGKVS